MEGSAMYAAWFASGIDLLNMMSQARMAILLNPGWLTIACVTFILLATNANFRFFLQVWGRRYVLRMALHPDDASLGRSLRSLCVLRIWFKLLKQKFFIYPFIESFSDA